jgi:hypothetical protein
MSEIDDYLARLRSHLSDLDPRRAEEIVAELRSHLEARAAELRAGGTEDDEATARAVGSFGDPEQVGRDLLQGNARHRHPSTLRAVAALAVALGHVVALDKFMNSPIGRDHLIAGVIMPLTGLDWGPAAALVEYGIFIPVSILVGMIGGRRFWWLSAAPVVIGTIWFWATVLFRLPPHVEIHWGARLIRFAVHAVPLGALLAGLGWLGSRLLTRRSFGLPIAAICTSTVAALWLAALTAGGGRPWDYGMLTLFVLAVIVLLLVAGRRDRWLSRHAFVASVSALCAMGLLLVIALVFVFSRDNRWALREGQPMLTVVAVACIVGALGTLIYWVRGRAADVG